VYAFPVYFVLQALDLDVAPERLNYACPAFFPQTQDTAYEIIAESGVR